MVGGDDAVIAGQGLDPGAVGLQPFAGVEEQQRASLSRFLDFERDARDSDHAGHERFVSSGLLLRGVYGTGGRGQWARIDDNLVDLLIVFYAYDYGST